MNASKSLLRPACFVSRRLATASSREKAHGRNLFALRRSGSTAFEIRCFSAQHEKVICYEDLVKETLKKMIAERDVDQLLAKPIADEDLRRRFQRFESVFKEAELCIADLREATGDQREEESLCATGAVDNAFQAYLDLLDDLRLANEDQLESYRDARHENASNLKRLRQELAEILGKEM